MHTRRARKSLIFPRHALPGNAVKIAKFAGTAPEGIPLQAQFAGRLKRAKNDRRVSALSRARGGNACLVPCCCGAFRSPREGDKTYAD